MQSIAYRLARGWLYNGTLVGLILVLVSCAIQPVTTAAPTAQGVRPRCDETQGQMLREQLISASYGRQQTYRVYLPPCYAQNTAARYPVIYLLHGGGHDDAYWEDLGIGTIASQLIADGTIPPVMIVLPNGNGSFGSRDGDPPPFTDHIINELIPRIDATYRTQANRAHRAIGGISLGGAWALLLASQFSELFSAVGGHSPAVGTVNWSVPDVRPLVQGHERIYLDVGSDDSLRGPTARLDQALTAAGYPHEYHVYPGKHEERYWSGHMAEYLTFYTALWHERNSSSSCSNCVPQPFLQ